ncbi:FtsX-like permease family protein [Streptomyces poriferorum]|uniref:FtsX-like permease family protein n=1 Tax=Streptomyces poriferorum TaxID=2798799 RepID=A0ABY9IZ28_9ACTN|nr:MULTISPECIES: FtsX-like permease family protein [unclassified Streptomyces]MDP5310045.1 FtsX-like permease family protein [Streptomyces sp. Alt4]WLQ60785.1 FtsX-like permease family protein [Streptomyces sp. Alt2]
MTGFVFLRVRAHRLLVTAALLAVLLTTAVLATLAAFSGSVGDAGLRHALQTRDAAAASLIIKAESPEADRAEAVQVRSGARQSFDGLPVTLREFHRSGPYALPRGLQPPAAREGEPDLTTFALADRSRVRLSKGAWPSAGQGDVIGVAVPEVAATQLKLLPGPRVLTLADRLGGPAVRIRVTGVYRPVDRNDPYWQLDELGGRGVHRDSFLTYGPMLTDAAAFGSGRITHGGVSWLATADFTTLGADRIDSLRTAAKNSQKLVAARPGLESGVTTRTSLPDVLGSLERALLVSRATLLIISLQLVLLAAYTLLLVARLLSTERAGETQVLLARGASRGRLAALSALEALLLALPAAALAPLLAGPLTRLLAGQGLLARIGLRIDTGPTAEVWLVGVVAALACAAAVVAPALTAAVAARGRGRTLPAPLRTGADIALVAVAAVAFWQLDRSTSGGGALSGDREGELGIDPLLVVAPALALLAGTVLTLRLLPPTAKLAERRATAGRGLTVPLAGWQISRRPLRGAGPVLLLVLAVSMGMLAIGQGASWDRSQDDQADFRAGAPVRVLGSGTSRFGQGGVYDGIPGVRAAVPAARTGLGLSGGRQATVLALDTGLAGTELRLRDDLADTDPGKLLRSLSPKKTVPTGVLLPDDTVRLVLDVTLSSAEDGPHAREGTTITLTFEDRFGVPYRLESDTLAPDGKPHPMTVDLAKAADAPAGRPAGPLALTGVEFDEAGYPDRIAAKRLTIGGMRSVTADGATRGVTVPKDLAWGAKATASVEPDSSRNERGPAITAVGSSPRTPLDVSYHTGRVVFEDQWGPKRTVTVRVTAKRGEPALPAALATDRFLESSGAKTGSVIDIPMPQGPVKVKIVGALRGVPTTGPGAGALEPAATPATDGGALLIDLRAVNRVLATRPDAAFPPTEWWLFTERGAARQVAAALRDRAEIDPTQIQVRDEIAEDLHDDPLGAGPQSALLAVALVAAALAAVGFAVGAVGTLRERSAEFAVLRALGAPRRQLARLLAVEQSLLIGLGLLIGLALGAVLTRAVVPLIVLTGQATQPAPGVLVELPLGRVALLVAGVAAAPVFIVAALAMRRGDTAAAMRVQGGE